MKPRRDYSDPLPNPGFETIVTHYAENPREQHGAAAPPIYQTSTFLYPDAEAFAERRTARSPHHDYSRVSNPTTEMLEAKLARLEHGKWGHCFGSGMGAISSAINAVVHKGAHVVCVAHAYGPTRSYLSHLQRFGVQTTYVAGCRHEDFVAALRPETTLLYLESPTSGVFECPAIEPLTQVARARNIRTIFDNSWATPFFMNPLDLGIDMVIHTASKYLNGHSDVVGGVCVGRDEELYAKIIQEAELGGAMMDPFAAWLVMRGLRTLSVRMKHHHEAGLALARYLESHPRVARVTHPGLESHPDHKVALQQLRGCGSLFSFTLKDNEKSAIFRFLNSLHLYGQGVSWGGHESLIIAGTMFSETPDKPQWLIRIYAGLESPADLIADLKQGLEK